jgi:hypothetical protein
MRIATILALSCFCIVGALEASSGIKFTLEKKRAKGLKPPRIRDDRPPSIEDELQTALNHLENILYEWRASFLGASNGEGLGGTFSLDNLENY